MDPEPLPAWHRGEITLQRTVGSDRRLATHGRRIFMDHLNEQHRRFYPLLPFLVAGSVDRNGDAWAGLLAGRPGFAHSPDAHTLSVQAAAAADDPAAAGIEDGNAIALLGIELSTRRRNRLNGIIERRGPQGFDVAVEQAFGNCPQYIQLRQFEFVRDPAAGSPGAAAALADLDERSAALIRGADTFFVASYVEREDGRRQVDVSHRGGKPGFVRVDGAGVLTIPDFPGNQFFNTLGNILVNPRAGLVFVDFEQGDVLQLSGDARVVLESPEIASLEGAERLWTFTPRHIVYRRDALPLHLQMEPGGWARELRNTGTWQSAPQ